MNFTAANLWEWTKLFARDPKTAATLVKAQKLPLEVSVLMIVLAGVISGVASGALDFLIGSPPMEFNLADGRTVTFERSGPITQGVYAVVMGLALGYAVFKVGGRMGGTGSLADIMGVTAVLQLIMTVILVAQTVAILVLPLLGLGLLLFGLYVFFRGLGHAVNVGHGYDDMGKSTIVIVLSFVSIVLVVFVFSALFGFGPQGVVQ